MVSLGGLHHNAVYSQILFTLLHSLTPDYDLPEDHIESWKTQLPVAVALTINNPLVSVGCAELDLPKLPNLQHK